ncbi:MAG: C45 family peptidase [Candidatus Bathyarchaeia archaeon]
MLQKVPFVKASGSSYDLGYVHGEQCSALIRRLFENVCTMARSDRSIEKDRLLSLSRKYLPILQKYAPDLVEETRGIADGAEVPHEQVIVLNVLWELVESKPESCTTFAISDGRMSDGDTLVAQNFDLNASFQEYGVLLELSLQSGLKILTFTFAGTVGQSGMNSEGVVRVGNGLVSSEEDWMGVPNYFKMRRTLEQKSVEEAIEIIRTGKSASLGWLLADGTGKTAYVEKTPSDYRVIPPANGLLTHANHFLHPNFLAHERGLETVPDSRARLSSINKLCSTIPDKFDIENAKDFLRDHTNYPASICRHETIGPLIKNECDRWKTLASLMLRPKSQILYICYGNPCKNDYDTVKLGSA